MSGLELRPHIAAACIMASLSQAEIGRYGRQLILPEWGVEGQQAVCSTSVLVVGAGGLGCPAALYLAAAGIGEIGLLDYDVVELGNLHRQILHTEKRVGVSKADSAKEALEQLNSHVKCTTHHVLLSSENALDILTEYLYYHSWLTLTSTQSYDIVVDATDNVATRYLLNDACVLLKKPLVSGSALRFEGQLTVYHYPGGPCYRCLFPSPPPPHTVTNCSEGGVLGAVPGVIGTMQALEVLKIAAKLGASYSQKLLLFDALEGMFRVIKLRPRQPHCAVCGDNPTITQLQDYELFCGSRADDKERSLQLLDSKDRISCSDYKAILDADKPHILLDVREPVEYQICCLNHSTNIPLKSLQSGSEGLDSVRQLVQAAAKGAEGVSGSVTCGEGCSLETRVSVYVICRRGNDSQVAVKLLNEYFGKQLYSLSTGDKALGIAVKDIVGGLSLWTDEVDPHFPKY